MRRLLTAAILVSGLLVSAVSGGDAQTAEQKCSAQLARSLTIRGLRLGMSIEETLALFPGASERQDVKSALANANDHPNYGQARLSFAPGNVSQSVRQTRFEGVSNINVTLFDSRLVSFSVQYPGFEGGGYSWKNVDDLISKFAETLRLPEPRYWNSNDGYTKHLDCGELRVSAFASGNGNGSITIADDSYVKVVEERRSSLYEKRRHEFKP